jgi:hypothetical protein
MPGRPARDFRPPGRRSAIFGRFKIAIFGPEVKARCPARPDLYMPLLKRCSEQGLDHKWAAANAHLFDSLLILSNAA